MASITNIAKMVAQSNPERPENKFMSMFDFAVKKSRDEYRPSKWYKPSGVGGCVRKMYFERIGQPIQEDASIELIGMGDSGTDRHERLQKTAAWLSENNNDGSFVWYNVGEYLDAHPVEGTWHEGSKSKNEFETYCRNELLQLSFFADGLVKLNGEDMVFEIKTESTFKFHKHSEPWDEHKYQATCYALCLGVDKVLFLYENRDTCEHKAFIFEVTEEWKDKVVDKISYVEDCVINGVEPEKKCGKSYCPYCKGRGRNAKR